MMLSGEAAGQHKNRERRYRNCHRHPYEAAKQGEKLKQYVNVSTFRGAATPLQSWSRRVWGHRKWFGIG